MFWKLRVEVIRLIRPYPRHFPLQSATFHGILWATRFTNIRVFNFLFLGAFEILRKTTISSVVYVYLSILTEQLSCHWTDFLEPLCLNIRKSVDKIQASLKSGKNSRHFTWRPIYIFDYISLSSSLNEKCFRTVVVVENTHFVLSNFPPRLNCAVHEIMWKNTVDPVRPHENMAHAHCMLNTQVYKHPLRIGHFSCFSIITMTAKTRLIVALCVHCLSCYFISPVSSSLPSRPTLLLTFVQKKLNKQPAECFASRNLLSWSICLSQISKCYHLFTKPQYCREPNARNPRILIHFSSIHTPT